MYLRQKGCLSIFTSTVGILLIGYFLVGGGLNLYQFWIKVRDLYSSAETNNQLISRGITIAILLLIFLPIGSFLSGLFPEIRVTRQGLKFRYLFFVTGIILWKEIEEVVKIKWPKDCYAVAISKPGFFLINGLWKNKIYGLIVGHEMPVILLSAKLQDREKVLKIIREHVNNI